MCSPKICLINKTTTKKKVKGNMTTENETPTQLDFTRMPEGSISGYIFAMLADHCAIMLVSSVQPRQICHVKDVSQEMFERVKDVWITNINKAVEFRNVVVTQYHQVFTAATTTTTSVRLLTAARFVPRRYQVVVASSYIPTADVFLDYVQVTVPGTCDLRQSSKASYITFKVSERLTALIFTGTFVTADDLQLVRGKTVVITNVPVTCFPLGTCKYTMKTSAATLVLQNDDIPIFIRPQLLTEVPATVSIAEEHEGISIFGPQAVSEPATPKPKSRTPSLVPQTPPRVGTFMSTSTLSNAATGTAPSTPTKDGSVQGWDPHALTSQKIKTAANENSAEKLLVEHRSQRDVQCTLCDLLLSEVCPNCDRNLCEQHAKLTCASGHTRRPAVCAIKGCANYAYGTTCKTCSLLVCDMHNRRTCASQHVNIVGGCEAQGCLVVAIGPCLKCNKVLCKTHTSFSCTSNHRQPTTNSGSVQEELDTILPIGRNVKCDVSEDDVTARVTQQEVIPTQDILGKIMGSPAKRPASSSKPGKKSKVVNNGTPAFPPVPPPTESEGLSPPAYGPSVPPRAVGRVARRTKKHDVTELIGKRVGFREGSKDCFGVVRGGGDTFITVDIEVGGIRDTRRLRHAQVRVIDE